MDSSCHKLVACSELLTNRNPFGIPFIATHGPSSTRNTWMGDAVPGLVVKRSFHDPSICFEYTCAKQHHTTAPPGGSKLQSRGIAADYALQNARKLTGKAF